MLTKFSVIINEKEAHRIQVSLYIYNNKMFEESLIKNLSYWHQRLRKSAARLKQNDKIVEVLTKSSFFH